MGESQSTWLSVFVLMLRRFCVLIFIYQVGLLGRKIGMRREVDLWGNVHPVTLVQIQNNHVRPFLPYLMTHFQVLATKSPEDHQVADKKPDYYTMQVGGGIRNWHTVTKQMMGLLSSRFSSICLFLSHYSSPCCFSLSWPGVFAKYDVDAKQKIVEFRVSPEALLPPGTPLIATHFVPGQFVDVSAISKGKGTQGPMRRHGFGGLSASHGVSKAHRSGGSIASGATDPGRYSSIRQAKLICLY